MLQTVSVALPKKLVARIDEKVKEGGYASRAEFVRAVLRKLLIFESAEEVNLSPEAVRRYNRMIDEIEKGKNIYKAESLEDFFEQLSK